MAKLNRNNFSEMASQHRANIAASLARRLEVARATNNQALIDQLERERQQLIPDMDL